MTFRLKGSVRENERGIGLRRKIFDVDEISIMYECVEKNRGL